MAIRPAEPGVLGEAKQVLRGGQVAPRRRQHAALGVRLRREDVERDRRVGFAEALDGHARPGDGGIEIESRLCVESRQQQPQLAPAHFGRRRRPGRATACERSSVSMDSSAWPRSSSSTPRTIKRARQGACGHRTAPAHVGDRGGGFGGAARALVGLGGQRQPPRIGGVPGVEWPHGVRGGVEQPLSQTLLDERDVRHFATGISRWPRAVKPRTQVVCTRLSGASQPLVRLRRVDVVDRGRIVHGHADRIGEEPMNDGLGA